MKYELETYNASMGGWLRMRRENDWRNSINIYTGKQGPLTEDYSTQMTLGGYFLGSCAVAGLKNFGGVSGFPDWQDKAEFLAGLYRALYASGHVLYCITDYQLKNAAHLALLEIGATQLAEFPNLYHGPQMAHVFLVNIRNAAGRFCNKYGEAYAKPEDAQESDLIPEQTKALPSGKYNYLPVKG